MWRWSRVRRLSHWARLMTLCKVGEREVGGGGMELCGWYIIIIWEGLINNQEK